MAEEVSARLVGGSERILVVACFGKKKVTKCHETAVLAQAVLEKRFSAVSQLDSKVQKNKKKKRLCIVNCWHG